MIKTTDLRFSSTDGLTVPVTTGTKVLLGPHDLLKRTDIWSEGQKQDEQQIIIMQNSEAYRKIRKKNTLFF